MAAHRVAAAVGRLAKALNLERAGALGQRLPHAAQARQREAAAPRLPPRRPRLLQGALLTVNARQRCMFGIIGSFHGAPDFCGMRHILSMQEDVVWLEVSYF